MLDDQFSSSRTSYIFLQTESFDRFRQFSLASKMFMLVDLSRDEVFGLSSWSKVLTGASEGGVGWGRELSLTQPHRCYAGFTN